MKLYLISLMEENTSSKYICTRYNMVSVKNKTKVRRERIEVSVMTRFGSLYTLFETLVTSGGKFYTN